MTLPEIIAILISRSMAPHLALDQHMIADPPLLHDELAEAARPRGPSAVSAWRLGPGRAVPRLLDGPPKVRLGLRRPGRFVSNQHAPHLPLSPRCPRGSTCLEDKAASEKSD